MARSASRRAAATLLLLAALLLAIANAQVRCRGAAVRVLRCTGQSTWWESKGLDEPEAKTGIPPVTAHPWLHCPQLLDPAEAADIAAAMTGTAPRRAAANGLVVSSQPANPTSGIQVVESKAAKPSEQQYAVQMPQLGGGAFAAAHPAAALAISE